MDSKTGSSSTGRRRTNLTYPASQSKGGKGINAASLVICATVFAILSVFVVGVYTVQSSHSERLAKRVREEVEHEMSITIDRLKADAASLLQNATATSERKLQLEQELDQVKKDALKVTDTNSEITEMRETLDQMDKRVQRLVKYKKKLQNHIKQLSMIHLLRQFGPGPHYVEIQLGFDPDSNVAKETEAGDKIIIEMAPVTEMPHAVYWFLEQVKLGLYVGGSFHRNAPHVVQAGPTRNFMTPPDAGLVSRFVEAGFNGILFQEYSENFPHKKYTLGYAGRPGGPDFYVSVLDNTKNHGPGGQDSYADPSEADPCFAKVISGFEAVDRMHRSLVKPGGYKHMEHNVAIVNMTWFTNNTDPVPPIITKA